MIGVENGWFGAQDAYDYLWPFIGVDPIWGSAADLGQRAGWALDYYPSSAPDPAPLVRAVLQSPAAGATLATTQVFTNGTPVPAPMVTVSTSAPRRRRGSHRRAGVGEYERDKCRGCPTTAANCGCACRPG